MGAAFVTIVAVSVLLVGIGVISLLPKKTQNQLGKALDKVGNVIDRI